jgi:hypothetical protein
VDGRTLENGWTRCAEQTNYLVEMCISPGWMLTCTSNRWSRWKRMLNQK